MRSIVPAMLSGQHRVRILDAMRSWVSDPGRPDRDDDRDHFPLGAPWPFAAQRQPRHCHAIREHSPGGPRQSAPHGHLRVRPANCIRVIADGVTVAPLSIYAGLAPPLGYAPASQARSPRTPHVRLRMLLRCLVDEGANFQAKVAGGRFVDFRLQPEAIATSANGNTKCSRLIQGWQILLRFGAIDWPQSFLASYAISLNAWDFREITRDRRFF